MNTTPTPLEALQRRKQELRQQARLQEEKMGDNFRYIQDNGGKLVLHSMTAALIPGKSASQRSSSASGTPHSGLTNGLIGGVSTALKSNTGILPMLWQIAQPFVLTWGIKGVKKLFGRKRK